MLEYKYKVAGFDGFLTINSDWDKSEWQNAEEIVLMNKMGEEPLFRPEVRVKMMYNSENLYIIFKVNDKFVKCLTAEVNGPVYKDSCVEFFFSPNPDFPHHYFNLEINCGGTALFHFNTLARKEKVLIEEADISKLEIAHSMPLIVDPEIKEPVIWTVECRIPLGVLQKYSKIDLPARGISWPANFYKIAESGSNVHFITWSLIPLAKPDFHRPEYFGNILFQ